LLASWSFIMRLRVVALNAGIWLSPSLVMKFSRSRAVEYVPPAAQNNRQSRLSHQ
jgi:hypothetical protein